MLHLSITWICWLLSFITIIGKWSLARRLEAAFYGQKNTRAECVHFHITLNGLTKFTFIKWYIKCVHFPIVSASVSNARIRDNWNLPCTVQWMNGAMNEWMSKIIITQIYTHARIHSYLLKKGHHCHYCHTDTVLSLRYSVKH